MFYNVTTNAVLSEDDLDTLNAGSPAAAASPDVSLPGLDGSRFGENTVWRTAAALA